MISGGRLSFLSHQAQCMPVIEGSYLAKGVLRISASSHLLSSSWNSGPIDNISTSIGLLENLPTPRPSSPITPPTLRTIFIESSILSTSPQYYIL